MTSSQNAPIGRLSKWAAQMAMTFRTGFVAEEEACMRLSEVQQSGAWYAVSASVAGVPAGRIRISVDEDAALISADTEANDAESQERESVSKYFAIRWPESVNPQTASAYLKNGTLTLVARKTSAAIAEVREVSAAKPAAACQSGAKS